MATDENEDVVNNMAMSISTLKKISHPPPDFSDLILFCQNRKVLTMIW